MKRILFSLLLCAGFSALTLSAFYGTPGYESYGPSSADMADDSYGDDMYDGMYDGYEGMGLAGSTLSGAGAVVDSILPF